MEISRATRDLKLAEKLATLLDTSFRIPGTRFRFGLDPLIGLFPFVGDMVTLAMSLVLLFLALRNGAGSKLVLMMALNVLVDTLGGSIPLIGAIFDFFYKSNTRNLDLLRGFILEQKHAGSGKDAVFMTIAVLFILFAALVFLIGIIISGFFSVFPGIYNWFVDLFR